jgi:outer membrane protein TolC
MRRLLVSCIIISMLLCGVVTFAAATEQEVITLSFAQAAITALDSNLDIRLARLSFENTKKSLERAVMVGDEEEIETATESMQKATAEYETAEQNLILEVEQRYLDLLAAQERLEEQKVALADAERSYEQNKVRYQAGLIAALDLEKAANTFFSATNSYDNQVSTTQTNRLRFNEILGLPLSAVVELAGDIVPTFLPLEMTLDEAQTTATLHSDAYAQALETLENAKAAVKAANTEFTPVAEYERTLFEQQKAEINLAKAQQKLFFDVRSSLITVQQREKTVELRKRELGVAQTNHKAAQIQYNAGTISEDILQERADAVVAAEKAHNDAIWDHVNARRDFFRLLGTPEPMRMVLTDEK